MIRIRPPSTFLPLPLLATVGLLLAGCGGSSPTADTPGLPDGFPEHSPAEIQNFIVGTTDTIEAFSARARISVRSPEQNQSFSAVVRQRRADSLYMEFSMFGVQGGQLLLTADSVFFFDARRAELRVGPASAIQEIVPIPVGSGTLFNNMLGLVRPRDAASWSVRADSSLYYLTASRNSEEKLTVDPTRWRVVRYTEAASAGQVTQQRLFSNFRSVSGVLIAHQLVFRRPVENLSATVTYRSIDLNPPDLSLDLDVPSQIPRKPLQ